LSIDLFFLDKFTTFSVAEHCLPLCRETKYRTTMSYELLSSKFMADMRLKHGLQSNDELVIIKIFFTETNFNTIVHKAYTLLDCFGKRFSQRS
jgi:hypothetical protein